MVGTVRPHHGGPGNRRRTSSPRALPSSGARREGQPDNPGASGRNLLALGTSISGAASLAASAVGSLSPRRHPTQQQRPADPGGLGGARPAAAVEEVPHPPPQGLRARPAPSGNDPGPLENRPSSEAPAPPSSGPPSDTLLTCNGCLEADELELLAADLRTLGSALLSARVASRPVQLCASSVTVGMDPACVSVEVVADFAQCLVEGLACLEANI